MPDEVSRSPRRAAPSPQWLDRIAQRLADRARFDITRKTGGLSSSLASL
jgi:hypothetical protein